VAPEVLKGVAAERGHALSPEEVRALVGVEIRRCTASAAAYKVPQTFEVSAEELPKTSTRKVKRFLFSESRA
jgi:hypothetical protein